MSEQLLEYEALIREHLIGKPLALGEITAFKCIRLCFGELHTIDRKFETYAGQITNGEFNLIIEQMRWNFIQDDEPLVSDQMEAQEIGVMWGFVQTRNVRSVSLTNSSLRMVLDDDIELIAEKHETGSQEAEPDGLRWYFTKGEEWLLTFNETEQFEYSELGEG